jgi:hypothetical protein
VADLGGTPAAPTVKFIRADEHHQVYPPWEKLLPLAKLFLTFFPPEASAMQDRAHIEV